MELFSAWVTDHLSTLEHVTVHSSERAVPFYQRVGFQHDQRWLRWQPE
ncbi:acetyltransferase (GNAT) family protein [Micromonospora palomenae]|uniref:Acetyltransferase (GNAT) family protein n=1 Tax=Micromonospora palomenae TaxID=1461247 RepID=A0A561WCK7_9ACTN|nr:GNAT family N-acetyltransferase [Micromonospora palomenae]TWG21601.1 acetyltransferase (GNAT) family protein [Micromonospora palomenae]